MEAILDIHTHKEAPQPEGVISMEWTPDCLATIAANPGQRYSLAYHPWKLGDGSAAPLDVEAFREAAAHEQVVAIGECGIDIPKGGALFAQINAFRTLVEISEEVKKPMILHDVKAHDVIVGTHKDMAPKQRWVIHGFRGKPTVAEMMLREEIYLSFGEAFNADTLKQMPVEMILAETDESKEGIREIIARLSEARGEDMMQIIERNTKEFLADI